MKAPRQNFALPHLDSFIGIAAWRARVAAFVGYNRQCHSGLWYRNREIGHNRAVNALSSGTRGQEPDRGVCNGDYTRKRQERVAESKGRS